MAGFRLRNLRFRPIADIGSNLQNAGSTTHGCEVTEALHALLGAFVAILLDWSVYTHFSAYLRVGFPTTPFAKYRHLAWGDIVAIGRTTALAATGVGGGLAFTWKLPSLWLVAVGLFAAFHLTLYALLYRRKEQP